MKLTEKFKIITHFVMGIVLIGFSWLPGLNFLTSFVLNLLGALFIVVGVMRTKYKREKTKDERKNK